MSLGLCSRGLKEEECSQWFERGVLCSQWFGEGGVFSAV